MDVKSLTDEQKLKLTVYNGVSEICDDVGANNTYVGKFSVTKDAKAIITELIYKKIIEYGEDLEAFAQHAKRSRISMEDVGLLLRRREQTISTLATSVERQEEEQEEQNEGENSDSKVNSKKRKRGTTSSKRGAKK